MYFTTDPVQAGSQPSLVPDFAVRRVRADPGVNGFSLARNLDGLKAANGRQARRIA
jgi:hypothetical protein